MDIKEIKAMDNTNQKHDDGGFLLQLNMRAQQKAKEYVELVHERQRLEMRIERTKEYIEQLNIFLRAEGQQPVLIKEVPIVGSIVGKPGNRAKDFPIRKVQWEGLTINEIIERILNTSPDMAFRPSEIAAGVYEIESDTDLKMVMHNMRSYMQRGARDGKWERVGRGKFKAKSTEKQGALINT
jgi:hypothetical protein